MWLSSLAPARWPIARNCASKTENRTEWTRRKATDRAHRPPGSKRSDYAIDRSVKSNGQRFWCQETNSGCRSAHSARSTWWTTKWSTWKSNWCATKSKHFDRSSRANWSTCPFDHGDDGDDDNVSTEDDDGDADPKWPVNTVPKMRQQSDSSRTPNPR